MKDDTPKFCHDDGTEVNPDLIPKPSLCISCKKDELGNEEVLCDLNRMAQLEVGEFQCESYELKDPND